MGLKILTVLFIGGASGSAQLLGCQEVDGAGSGSVMWGGAGLRRKLS